MRESEGRKSGRRTYIVALFLPLLLGVVICASNAGVNWLRQDQLEVEVEALATANYGPWELTRFAPVQPRLGTQLAIDSATDRPNYIAIGVMPSTTPMPETPFPTLVAQVPTNTPTSLPTITTAASSTITNTPLPTTTASFTPTNTPLPTTTNSPFPTSTSLPTLTNTPLPTTTPQPTATNFIAAPVAAFQVTPATGIAPLNVTITNQSSGQITNYNWTFGDGVGTSTAASPGTYTYSTPNTYTIRLTVTGPGGSTTATQTITVTSPAPTDANLSLSKSASVPTANIGDNFTYTLVAANAGPVGATGVTISDALPSQVVFVSSSQCGANGQSVTCSMGSIANGSNATATITVRAISAGSATNTATVSANQPDPNTSNNTASATVTINAPPPEADIEIISYTPSNFSPDAGESITITLTVRNNGTIPVDNVVIGATSGDPGLSLSNYAPSQGVMNGDVWEIGTLLGGQTTTLVTTSVVDIGAGGTSITRSRSITNTSITDPNGSNNTGSFTLNVQALLGAELSLNKSASVMTASVGQTFTYTISVSNNGPDDANNITIIDTLPTQVSYVSGPGSCSHNSGVVTCVIPLLGGASGTASVTYTVQATGTGTAVNGATVSADEPDPNPSNNDASATVTIINGAELAVSVTAAADTALENGSIGFTIGLQNNGPLTGTGIIVQVSHTSGLNNNPGFTPSGGTTFNNSTGVWTIPTLNSGQSVTMFLNHTTGFDIEGTTQTVTAEITAANEPDPILVNNIASDNVTMLDATGLFFSKTASVTTVNVGDAFQYFFEVENIGPSDTTGVIITDILPPQVVFVSSAQCSAAGQDVTCNLGALADGTVANANITVQAVSAGTAVNNASVLSDLPDGNMTNNQDDVTVTITAAEADLEITTFDFNNNNPAVGESITATLIVTNNGPLTATNIRVSDSNGSGTLGNLDNINVTHGTSTGGAWDIPSLNSGETATMTLTLTVDAATAGTTVNRWREIIASDQPDPDSTPNNGVDTEDDYNGYSVTVQPLAQVDLQLTKSAPSIATVNTPFDYTLTVSNIAAANATDVILTDTLPSQVTFVSSPQCSAGGQNVTCNLGTINAGGNTVATITVMPVTPGNVINTANVTSTQTDANPGDNNDSATVTIGPEFLRLVSLCSAEPATQHRWRVDNFNPFPVTFTWQEYLGPNTGVETVPEATGVRGEIIFFTPAISSSLQIWVPNVATGVLHDTTASGGATCDIDLALTKTVDNPTPQVGQAFTFTVSVFNGDTHQASGVQVTDNMPAGLTIQGTPTASHGTYNPGTDTWDIGTLPVGETATLTITVTAASPGTYSNTATISAANQPDANTSNNSDTATSTVSAPPSADIAVSLNVSTTAYTGTNITFTVTVDNLGPDAASNIQINSPSPVPAGLVYVSDTSGGAYNSGTGVWTIPALANGASTSIDIVATVDGTQSSIDIAVALASLDQDDTNAANDIASTTVFVVDVYLLVDIAVNNPNPVEGTQVVYTVTADNYGSGVATGILIDVPIPAGLTYVSDNGVGNYDPVTGAWTIPNLGSGFIFQLQITATVNIGTGGSAITKTATLISLDQPDQSIGDDTDSVTINVVSADADVYIASITAAANPILVGETTTVTANIGNNGPQTANDLTLNFNLPNNLTIVSHSCNTLLVSGVMRTCTILAPLTSGGSSAITFNMSGASSGALAMTFTVSADQADPNPANNSGSITITVDPVVDIIMTFFIVDDETPIQGQNITYELRVRNLGPSPATGVRISVPAPAGVNFISGTSITGTYDPVTGIWNIGAMGDGELAILTINANVTAPAGTIVTAQASVDNVDQVEADTSMTSNQIERSITVDP